jgi:cytochrome P450
MPTPDHVPSDRVFEFNIYSDARLRGDLHEQLKTLHADAPDVFWTHENGGHWVLTRFDDIDEVSKDYERFSNTENRVPRLEHGMVTIPLNLDPPEHTFYRHILLRHFGPPAIRKLEPRVEGWARRLVSDVSDKGRCDFMEDVASLFPVSIFMEMMGLPLERLREYRAIVVEYFGECTPERWLELQAEITRQMRDVIDQRQAERQDDMISQLLDAELDGRKMTLPELEALSNLLFQAGMDTVANFAGFFFRFLGERPDIQRRIREHPEEIPAIVEEGFRLFGVVNSGRVVKKDTNLRGIEMRAGDLIICMLPLAGLDERRNPDPEAFMVDRPGRDHLLFSKGVHLCIGHTLARAEMRYLLAEWFKAVPEFRIAEGYEPVFRAGQVMGLSHLPLEWPADVGRSAPA